MKKSYSDPDFVQHCINIEIYNVGMNEALERGRAKPKNIEKIKAGTFFELGKLYLLAKNYQKSQDAFIKAWECMKKEPIPHSEKDIYTLEPPNINRIENFFNNCIDYSIFSGKKEEFQYVVDRVLLFNEQLEPIEKCLGDWYKDRAYLLYENSGLCSVYFNKEKSKEIIEKLHYFEEQKIVTDDDLRFHGAGLAEALDGIYNNKPASFSSGIDLLLAKFHRVHPRNIYSPICEIACDLYAIARMKKMDYEFDMINLKYQKYITGYFDQNY